MTVVPYRNQELTLVHYCWLDLDHLQFSSAFTYKMYTSSSSPPSFSVEWFSFWIYLLIFVIIVVVQSLSCVRLFATPWTAAHQASLSFTISRSLLKLMSIVSMMPSNRLIFCCPLLLFSSVFPETGSLPVIWLFPSCGQSIGASASALVLPVNIQGWFFL